MRRRLAMEEDRQDTASRLRRVAQVVPENRQKAHFRPTWCRKQVKTGMSWHVPQSSHALKQPLRGYRPSSKPFGALLGSCSAQRHGIHRLQVRRVGLQGGGHGVRSEAEGLKRDSSSNRREWPQKTSKLRHETALNHGNQGLQQPRSSSHRLLPGKQGAWEVPK